MPIVSNAQYASLARRKIELSRHASRRARQRAISQDCVPLILAYGERSHDGHGGIRYLLTRRSMAALGALWATASGWRLLLGATRLSTPLMNRP